MNTTPHEIAKVLGSCHIQRSNNKWIVSELGFSTAVPVDSYLFIDGEETGGDSLCATCTSRLQNEFGECQLFIQCPGYSPLSRKTSFHLDELMKHLESLGYVIHQTYEKGWVAVHSGADEIHMMCL